MKNPVSDKPEKENNEVPDRVFRGGDFEFGEFNLRPVGRYDGYPPARSDELGFRVVRNKPKSKK